MFHETAALAQLRILSAAIDRKLVITGTGRAITFNFNFNSFLKQASILIFTPFSAQLLNLSNSLDNLML